jgi:hypothetical protein
MEIHEFDPVIYPVKLWVLIDASVEEINKNFERDNDKHNPICLEDFWTACASCINTKLDTKEFGVYIVIIKANKITPGVLAHEACHLSDTIYNHIGATQIDLGGEPHAYLTEWIVDSICKVVKLKTIKIKKIMLNKKVVPVKTKKVIKQRIPMGGQQMGSQMGMAPQVPQTPGQGQLPGYSKGKAGKMKKKGC